MIAELEERFVNNPSYGIAVGLLYLIPNECINLGEEIGVPEDLAGAVDEFYLMRYFSQLSMVCG